MPPWTPKPLAPVRHLEPGQRAQVVRVGCPAVLAPGERTADARHHVVHHAAPEPPRGVADPRGEQDPQRLDRARAQHHRARPRLTDSRASRLPRRRPRWRARPFSTSTLRTTAPGRSVSRPVASAARSGAGTLCASRRTSGAGSTRRSGKASRPRPGSAPPRASARPARGPGSAPPARSREPGPRRPSGHPASSRADSRSATRAQTCSRPPTWRPRNQLNGAPAGVVYGLLAVVHEEAGAACASRRRSASGRAGPRAAAQPRATEERSRGGGSGKSRPVERAPGLEQQHLVARLAELLRRPAAGGAGADHHGVVDRLAQSTLSAQDAEATRESHVPIIATRFLSSP